MISTNWSMPDSPGKSGDPVSNSAMTQPVDQTSSMSTETQTENTNKSGIVGCTKDEFRGAIISGTDITDIGLSFHENLCAAKITKFENSTGGVQE